jgi:hypothetical protein
MKDFSDTLFQKTYTEVVDLKDSTIPDERLDELFDNGHISSKEYSFLMRKLYSTEKKISVYSVLCLVVSAISWVSFLKFEFGDDVYQLMSGSMRFKVVSFLAPMAVFFAVLAFREIKSRNRNGVEVAIVGCTIAIAQLTIVIPVWLMKLY